MNEVLESPPRNRMRLVAQATAWSVGALFGGTLVVLGAHGLGFGIALFSASAALLLSFATPRAPRRGVVGIVLLGLFLALARPSSGRTHLPSHVFDGRLDNRPVTAPWFGAVDELEFLTLARRLLVTPGEAESLDLGSRELAREMSLSKRADALEALAPRRAPQRLIDDLLPCGRDYRLLRPEGKGPFPLLVFLHGDGGLAECYTQLLQSLATDYDVAVCLPVDSFADAGDRDARRRLDRLIRKLVGAGVTEPDAVSIGGLSAGAKAALRLFAVEPEGLLRCIAISGVPLDDFPITRDTDGEVYLFAGARDERVPLGEVRDAAERMERAGLDVSLRSFDADHLLLLTERERVLEHVAELCSCW